MNQPVRVFLSLGSNLGDSRAALEQAVRLLEEGDVRIIQLSSFYRTKAWGKTDQPDFLNAVLEAETLLTAPELLKFILQTERKMGRERLEKWGPRTIDIDILYYGNTISEEQELVLPHPHLHLRKFVLVPLNEIAPDFIHPVFQKNTAVMLQESPDNSDPVPVSPH